MDAFFDKLARPSQVHADVCLDPSKWKRRSPVQSATLTQSTFSVERSWGRLGSFPQEVLDNILVNCNLRAVLNFRKVSKHARAAIDNLPEYNRLLNLAPKLLRSFLTTGVAPWFSVADIYGSILTISACRLCGDFGPYAYLLDCSRVCYRCFTEDPYYKPATFQQVKAIYDTSDWYIQKNIPVLHPLPGLYSEAMHFESRRDRLVNRTDVLAWINKTSGPWPFLRFEDEKEDRRGENTDRFKGVVEAPFNNKEKRCGESGLECLGCIKYNQNIREVDWRRRYTKEGFLEHIEECPATRAAIRKLQRHSAAR